MIRRIPPSIGLAAVLALATISFGALDQAFAQAKTVLTFAGVTFSEAGRGDRLKAWVEKFNKSQDKIEVQPLALPFATLANTVVGSNIGVGITPAMYRSATIRRTAA